LGGKGKKGKGKKSQTKLESNQEGMNKDLSKIKFFNCHKFGHYATKRSPKKLSKNTLGGVEGEAMASHFELDFTGITCMVVTCHFVTLDK